MILIDHLNGVRAATEYLAKVHNRSCISLISRAEILAGYDEARVEPIKEFLGAFPLLPLDRDIVDLAAALRRHHRWKLPDAFQAAVAKTEKLKLATRNTNDFPPEKFEFVVVPYTL